ncbi:MAG: hypothetical protein J3K34DRAFT_517464 [Monoraphidium minutum]|nr:MAG: hypothetical protein J3K34DRAFT_517464 [Monoraphidium minutum]
MFGGGGFDHQFGGGGFMPTQQQDQGGGGGGGGAGSGGRARNKEQTLRAAVVKQLVEAAAQAGPDQDLVVDGVDLSNVTLVGRVLTVAERGGNLDLQITDGTGTVSVTYFGDTGDGDAQALAQKRAAWQPGTYVRVYGNVRSFNNVRSVQAFAIRAIHDFNELTYHLLQTVFQHLHIVKGGGTGTGGGAPQPQAGFAGGYGGPAAGGWQAPPQQPAAAAPPQGGYGGGGGGGGPGGLDPCAGAVHQIISDPGAGEQGVHVNDICARLQGRFNRQAVTVALTFLQNEAHAYTTCDDNHWRATG